MKDILIQLQKAKLASQKLYQYQAKDRNEALDKIANSLLKHQEEILEANSIDLAKAKNLSVAMRDRLKLDKKRIEGMANGLRKLIKLPDLLGEEISSSVLENGLRIIKTRVSLGVVGMIYEARPNVSSDAAGLCLKSGNAVILKGGKEALNTNRKIIEIFRAELDETMRDSIQFIDDSCRETTLWLMQQRDFIDVLIPRGGQNLIHSVIENAKIPVIETGSGNCHIYVDKEADYQIAEKVILNAKTTRVSVCNSIEKLLIHHSVADVFLPQIVTRLLENGVEIIADKEGGEILKSHHCDRFSYFQSEEELFTEYLDYKIGIKIVKNLQDAIGHINYYGTHHSDCIITDNEKNAQEFLLGVDSAAVYVNASTRFSDGEEFGFGVEIGISTQKLHVRGPMGLEALTSYKYCIKGNGQIRV